MTEHRAGLPAMPARIARLPVNDKGYPTPFFVAYVDGKPEFRAADSAKLRACIKRRLCWVCGEPLGTHLAFGLGPMCTITRTSSEPPMHRDCAVWSAQACPFLILPKAQRRDANLPADVQEPAGLMIPRNPGCVAVWMTRNYSLFSDGKGGVLIRVGDPDEVLWYAEGRAATRAEVMASIDSGCPIIEAEANKDNATHLFEACKRDAMQYLPNE